ncbi:MAG: UvrD-helicase domain-containing protein, partial [Pseudomonadota bacterium]
MPTEPEFTPRQEQILAFRQNMCVVAGAGTGKTMTLVGLILRLLDPEGELPTGLDLTRILALTYTEKAAREMRDRLRQALNLKARTAADEWRTFWKRQRRLLDRARISTLHSFGLHLLREFNFEARIDPDFAVLDDSRDFVGRVRREALLDWVQQQEPDFLELLEYFPWMTRGRSLGIDDLLGAIYGHSRCFGRQAESAETEPIPTSPHLEDLLKAAGLIDGLIEQGAIPPDKGYFKVVRGFSEAVRRLLRLGMTDNEIFSALPELQAGLTGNWYKAAPAKDMASEALTALAGERDRRASLKLKEKLARLADKMGRIE